MKKIIDFIEEELGAAFEKAGYDRSLAKVTVSNRPDLCEYQCNGAMAGAKAYHKAPFMIADDVIDNLVATLFSKSSIAPVVILRVQVIKFLLLAFSPVN